MKRFMIIALFITISALHAAENLPPIFTAINKGDLGFVHKYIEDGGSVTVRTAPMGPNAMIYTPIEWAVMYKQIPIIKELLANPKSRSHIDINQPDVYDRTLLTYVVGYYDDNAEGQEVVQLLLNSGININHKTKWMGLTSLRDSAINGKINFFKLLLQYPGINVNSRDNEENSVLIQISKEFLNNKKNKDNRNQAHILKAIQLLLEAGADVSTKNKAGESFIDYTKKDTDLENVYRQFKQEKAKANPHIKELLTAAKNDDIEGIKKLLTVVDVNTQNEAGITALMRAAQNNNVDTVEFLLSKKANPNMVDDQGTSALEWALYTHPHTSKPVQRNVKHILELLLQAGAKKTEQARKTAVKFGYPEDIIALLK